MNTEHAGRKILESWKQIADYLRCSERTAKRYESKGIPVYRVGALQHQRVFAYADELDHWLHEGGSIAGKEDSKEMDLGEEASGNVSEAAQDKGPTYLCLETIEGLDKPGSHIVGHFPTIMGRDIDATMVIADQRISRCHACIDREGSAFFLKDLESRNGTSVNGKRICERVQLRQGDLIRLGGAVTFRVVLVFAGETAEAGAK